MSMSDETLKRATEITIAALADTKGTWVQAAPQIATFFETIARKIDQLRSEPDSEQPRYSR